MNILTQHEIAKQAEAAAKQYNDHQHHLIPVDDCVWCDEGTSHCRLAEQDARDAARYRWLRDRMCVEDVPPEHPSWSTPSEHESVKFDEAVDATMAKEGKSSRGYRMPGSRSGRK